MSSRWWRWPVGLLVAIGLAGAGFWAGRVTLAPVAVPVDLPASEVLVEVSEQSVGRTLNLGVTVEQPKRVLATNGLVGVVTSVSSADSFEVGDTLYTVARVPVRAVQGSLPFYRELAEGMSGKDVEQLRSALVKLGHLKTKGTKFDAATRQAVRAWQKKLDIPQSGTVALGELVAVPKLPVALVLDDQVIGKGGVLAGGERVVYGAVGEPEFSLVLSEQQARLVPASATVRIEYEGKQWQGMIAESSTTEYGEVKLRLVAPDSGPVCGADCAVVATGSAVTILSQVEVVPPASGPAVPVAAITTHADGSTTVTVVDAASTRTDRPVTVLGSQDGVAVVDGVAVGEQVQVLGGDGGSGGQAAPAEPDGSPAPTPEPSR